MLIGSLYSQSGSTGTATNERPAGAAGADTACVAAVATDAPWAGGALKTGPGCAAPTVEFIVTMLDDVQPASIRLTHSAVNALPPPALILGAGETIWAHSRNTTAFDTDIHRVTTDKRRNVAVILIVYRPQRCDISATIKQKNIVSAVPHCENRGYFSRPDLL